MDFDKLDALLKAKNMSRRALALAVGINEGTMSTAFRRRSGLSASDLIKIAQYLGVSPAWLAGLIDTGSEEDTMTFSGYQELARRTQNPDLTPRERLEHATWGLVAEVGEVCGLFQKIHQGHQLDQKALFKELGDICWFIAELCDVYDFDMGSVAEANIDKLRKRYPEGFSTDKSLHRAEGDI